MFLFINSYSPEYFLYGLHKTFLLTTERCENKYFCYFFVSSGRLKDQEFSFPAVNLLKIQLFQTCLGRVFAYFQETPTLWTLVSCCSSLSLTWLYDYMMSVLIENKTPIMLMLLHLWKQQPGPVRYFKKVFTHHLVVKKPFSFFNNFDFDDK